MSKRDLSGNPQRKNDSHFSSLGKRVASSFLVLPLVYAALFTAWGEEIQLILVSLMQGWALWEFFVMAERKGVRVPLAILIVLGVVLELIGYFSLRGVDPRAPLCALAVLVPTMLFIWQMSRPIEGTLRDVSAGLLGFVYISVPLALLFAIRQFQNGPLLITLLLTANFCADIGAYFVGSQFGRKKLCPRISPKKTVEGVFGGILGALVGTLLLGFMVQWLGDDTNTFLGISHPGLTRYVHALALAVLLSLFGLVGDLGESMLKRESGVKDSGTLFVGHGGILDVIDALLFNAPIFYVYARLFFS